MKTQPRVLVTGGTGFLGRQCLPLLVSAGFETHAVSSKLAAGERGAIRWHHADLLDRSQVMALIARVQPTHLLHLAWQVDPGQWAGSTVHQRWLQASLELLREFADLGGQRVVTAGSCAEYDWRYGLCSEETTPLRPSTPYGACKHALSTVVESYARERGLSAGWARIFFLYGPFEHRSRLVASVTRSLLMRTPALCTHGNQVRDFMHVSDAADALVRLLGSDLEGAVNVGSGVPLAVKDLVLSIANKLEATGLVRLGAIALPGEEAPLVLADVSRLRKELGWRPAFDLAEGLDRTIEWWQQELALEHVAEHLQQ